MAKKLPLHSTAFLLNRGQDAKRLFQVENNGQTVYDVSPAELRQYTQILADKVSQVIFSYENRHL